jgi:membrane protein DedA with SNARE-associated domain
MILATSIVERATDIIDAIGLAGVAFLIALESIFPPIPSEVILLLSGFQVSQGKFNFVAAVLAATFGSVVGAFALYMVGRLLGDERMESLLAKVGKPLGFKRSDIDRADAWFDKYGDWVVFFGRLVPLVRSVVSIPAGANKMPAAKFALFTGLGSLVWNTVWIWIGYALEDQWEKAEKYSSYFQYLAIAAGVLILGWFVIKKRRSASAS